ncbi:MAG: TatD family hydrolase [Clostridia bacterium]|nr:TatD family hydrolase [Clostridia bacterium]
MIDTHCHLSMVLDENKNIDYNQICDILKQMKLNGVTHAITVGSNMRDSELSVEIAKHYDNIYCAVGVHPEEVESFDIVELEDLVKTNLNSGKVVAIGEIGLDYYWRKDNKEAQIEIFKKQIELAKKYNLPIVVHCRDAYGDTLEILKQYAPFDKGGVIHCYSGSIEWANVVIKLGFLISFTGVVTYPNASNVQEVAKWVDIDKFMVETDSPFLTPVPFRGKKNNPSYVRYTLEYIAKLKNKEIQEIDKNTTNNAIKLFKLKIK